MDNPDSKLIEEYRQRNIRWTSESLKQLSFYNNLLLTLSVGFLSFTFKPKDVMGLNFALTNIDWPTTLLVISLASIVLSILTGLLLAICRLQDFRLTRNLNRIRQRMLEHSKIKLNEDASETLDFWRRLTLPFQDYPNVTMEECKTYQTLGAEEREMIKFKFRELRNIAHNLGLNTWRDTKLQTSYFGFSVFMYLMSILLR